VLLKGNAPPRGDPGGAKMIRPTAGGLGCWTSRNTLHDTETRGRISMRRKVVRRRVTCDNLAEPYRSDHGTWIKVKNSDAPAATRLIEG
jgi:hypothetical protein